MNSYSLFRRLFFLLPAETAHNIALKTLSYLERVGGIGLIAQHPIFAPRTVMGITFPNSVGLAAGLDKNGAHIDALSKLGFGFIEVGTVTPKAQPGNPKPRLFRLEKHQAIINRMGFNNNGVEGLLENLRATNYTGVLGINIGKNATTPLENAVRDYVYCLEHVYKHADYITVNLSSPNTPGLRGLQMGELFSDLLCALKEKQRALHSEHGKYVPLVVKIAPDLNDEEITSIAQTLISLDIDGVIATNTTVSRKGVEDHIHAKEAGGLSGKPVFEASTHVVRVLAHTLQGRIPIIAAGGIFSAEDALLKINAGASLVQIYTGFIYQGPELIRKISQKVSIGF